MIHQVIMLRFAEDDLLEHFAKLEEYQEGRGYRFDQDVQRAVSLLAEYPHIGSVYVQPLRKWLLRDWSIGIFYTVESGRVMISSLLDVRQHPERILQILRSRLPH
jgi:plasmid stabilization system protein ParE